MKVVKNYENFSEEYRLNENSIKNMWSAVVSFFKKKFGKHAWIYYALYLQKKGQLPKNKVELICPDSYLKSSVPTDSDFSAMTENNSKILEADESDYVELRAPDINMRDVNVKELKEKIKDVYEMNLLRANRHKAENYDSSSKYARESTHAVFIWGAPGIGKTEILHQLAKELEVAVLEWHLATIEPTDFRGIPKVENIKGSNDPRDERTVSKLPSIFPTSDGDNGKGGIMFFDELNRAPEMVLSASLALALGGKHGEYELPPRWIIMAAGNRPDDIPGRLQDDPILWNRFSHVNYVPDLEEWFDYISKLPHINPDLVEFIKKYPKYYHRLAPLTNQPNWPSPRTWEMASEEDYFERGEDWKNVLPKTEVSNIYQDMVGHEAGTKFADFVEEQDKKRREERMKAEREKGGKGGKFGKGDMMSDMPDRMPDVEEDDMDELDLDKFGLDSKDSTSKKYKL
jgi:hypothetical protein